MFSFGCAGWLAGWLAGWVQVRGKAVVTPGHPGLACGGNCHYQVTLLAQALERGMASGRLALPEGVPFIVNVDDQQPTACVVTEVGVRVP